MLVAYKDIHTFIHRHTHTHKQTHTLTETDRATNIIELHRRQLKLDENRRYRDGRYVIEQHYYIIDRRRLLYECMYINVCMCIMCVLHFVRYFVGSF